MRSIRFESDLDERVQRAAAAEGATVSEFLRRAAAERAERTLSSRNSDRLGDVIGIVHGSGAGGARDTGAAFGALLGERHERT